MPGDDARLNGVKVNVWNADRANVFIVFAKQREGDIVSRGMMDGCPNHYSLSSLRVSV